MLHKAATLTYGKNYEICYIYEEDADWFGSLRIVPHSEIVWYREKYGNRFKTLMEDILDREETYDKWVSEQEDIDGCDYF